MEYIPKTLDPKQFVKGCPEESGGKCPKEDNEIPLPKRVCPKERGEEHVRLVAIQMFSALAHIHSHDITHGDVKPDNILISDPLIAKLADFGQAELHPETLSMMVGTKTYLAPELWDVPVSYNSAADIFSFGLVLLQCLTACDLSREGYPDPWKWMNRVVVPLVETVAPKNYRLLLRGALRREPGNRWSALQCLAWLVRPGEPQKGEDGERRGKKRPASSLLQRLSTGALPEKSLSDLVSTLSWDTVADVADSIDAPTPGPDDLPPEQEQDPIHANKSDFVGDWM